MIHEAVRTLAACRIANHNELVDQYLRSLDEYLRGLDQRVARIESELAELRKSMGAKAPAPPPPPPPPADASSPAPPPAAAVVPAARPRTAPADEVSLVGSWLARVGAVAFLVGGAFAFKYAIDRGLITPFARVILGLVAGLLFAAGGEWARRRDWPGWAQAVTGGAVGLWYLSIWAAYQLYGLLGPPAALASLSAVTIAAVFLAIRHDSEALALLATGASFFNPFLVDVLRTVPVDAYMAVLLAGVLVLGWLREWWFLERLALAATWIAAGAVAGNDGLAANLLFGTGFFVLFAGNTVARRLTGRTVPDQADMLFLGANSIAYTIFGLLLLEEHAQSWQGFFAGVLGVVHLGLAGLVARLRSGDRSLWQTFLSLGTVLLALAVPLQFDGPVVPAVWTAQAVALLAVGRRFEAAPARWAGLALLVVAVFDSLLIEFEAGETYLPERILLSGESALLVFQVAAIAVASRLTGGRLEWAWARNLFTVGAHLLALTWLTFEVQAYFVFEIRGYIADLPEPVTFPVQTERLTDFVQARAFTITTLWALYGAVLLAVGVAMRSRTARMFAVGLFGAVILKLATYDVWLIGPLYRTIAFTGLGAVLLAASLLYHRFRDFVLGELEQAEQG